MTSKRQIRTTGDKGKRGDTAKAEELRATVTELQNLVNGLAERTSAAEFMSPELVEWELRTARRWLRAMLRVESELELRMWFTAQIARYAASPGRPNHPENARRLVGWVKGLSPADGRRLNVLALVNAVVSRTKGRWNWPAVVEAWGRAELSAESWRVEYARARRARGLRGT